VPWDELIPKKIRLLWGELSLTTKQMMFLVAEEAVCIVDAMMPGGD
jgi:hypothetical protein